MATKIKAVEVVGFNYSEFTNYLDRTLCKLQSNDKLMIRDIKYAITQRENELVRSALIVCEIEE